MAIASLEANVFPLQLGKAAQVAMSEVNGEIGGDGQLEFGMISITGVKPRKNENEI